MKKVLLAFLLFFVTQGISDTKIEYAISLIGMNMDYSEYDQNGMILDSEESNFQDILGAEFEYRYFLNASSNLEIKLSSLTGYTKYTGSYLNDSNAHYGSVVSSTKNTIYDFSFAYNMKKRSDFKNIIMLADIGVGYRDWFRELSSTQIEEYTWYSIRGNLGLEYHKNDFTGSFIVEYQYGIKPNMSATGFSDDFELASANIMKFSVPLRYNVYKNLDLTCAYIFEYQEIKESNVLYGSDGKGYVEPDSTAYNQYIKIGMLLKY